MIDKRIRQALISAQQAFKSPYFGFIQGHIHLVKNGTDEIKKLVGVEANQVVIDYEKRFAKLIGDGEAVSYAAARMGFYELMRLQGIGRGHEVILLGATCAVMVNAVMRAEATPIFSDIDPNTFGSSCHSIKASISSKTRMIVAQHSFGIPCDIEPIVKLAKENNIFLLEDCALTMGSKINGISVGNFGDAALFSTDHGKPLNTLIGGLIYTRNKNLADSLRISQLGCPELSLARQKALWRRLLLEAKYCVPLRYGRMSLLDMIRSCKKKLINAEGDFLSEDFGLGRHSSYPYPAKLPAFLAALGLIEISRWTKVANERSILLIELINVLDDSLGESSLPNAYRNKALQIVPLRLVWSCSDGVNIRKAIQHFIHVPWTWFLQPIIATNESLENFGYKFGSCPISEQVGPNMVNIPCIFGGQDGDKLIALIKKAII
jgi:perosamine synthetase